MNISVNLGMIQSFQYVTSLSRLIKSTNGGITVLFHLAGASYAEDDLPASKKDIYSYSSGIIFNRNATSCKIVLFSESADQDKPPIWKLSSWTEWRDFANNIVK